MIVKFTVRIKSEQNPPIFKSFDQPGVLEERIVEYPTVLEEEINSPLFIVSMLEYADKMKNEWIEVVFEPINSEEIK